MIDIGLDLQNAFEDGYKQGKADAEDLIKKIKQLEPYNNQDCPEWVINIIKGEING